MQTLLTASAASENSAQFDGSQDVVSTYLLDVTATGWTGTLKIAGRALGAQAGGASAYTGYIAIKDRSTDSVIAGSTGITAAGLYEINIAGLECRVEHTRSAGSVTVKGLPVLG